MATLGYMQNPGPCPFRLQARGVGLESTEGPEKSSRIPVASLSPGSGGSGKSRGAALTLRLAVSVTSLASRRGRPALPYLTLGKV